MLSRLPPPPGLAATSLAWGYWQTHTGLTAHLTDVDLARMTRLGLMPIATSHGLARSMPPSPPDSPFRYRPDQHPHLARHARDNTLAPILSALITTPRRRA
ncbi:putative type I polyketide synthase loading module, partial [Mycobacterium ulcerans str. Harvey]